MGESGAIPDTELAAPAALADGAANPTTSTVGAAGLVWNGASWDRAPGTAAAGTKVDTELPAAALLADGPGLPTSPTTGAVPLLYTGSVVNIQRSASNLSDAHPGQNFPSAATVAFNNSTFDRWRGNLDAISLVASAAYTTTQTSADQTNYNGQGVKVVVDITSAGTGSITVAIQMKDPVSGKYVALLTSAALVANGTTVLTVFPGVTVAANLAVSDHLPRTWRVVSTANNANSMTYSIGAAVLL